MNNVLSRRFVIAGLGASVAVSALAAVLSLNAGTALAAAKPGQPAPDFRVVDSNGDMRSLSEFAGKKVILEWTNHDCPYVQKHYDDSRKNMQGLQTAMTEQDVVWMSVISSAPGKQGHVSPEEANDLTASRQAAPSYVLMDETGEVGRLYGAKTTPHMFVIDEQQQVAYAGAIDDKRSADPADIDTATNYVVQAMNELDAGQPVSRAETAPYGCSVKY